MTPDQMKKWDGSYSLAVDQICELGGFKEMRVRHEKATSCSFPVTDDVTMDQLKHRVTSELQMRGCKGLFLVKLYKIRIPNPDDLATWLATGARMEYKETDACYLHIVCDGVFE